VKHSTSGQVFVFQRAAVSWGSKKQPTVALSSTEAEIMAASEAAKEALSLRKYIRDFKLGGDTPTQLFVDNQSAIAVAYNPEHQGRVKHMERRHFYMPTRSDMPHADPNLGLFFSKWCRNSMPHHQRHIWGCILCNSGTL
jgi:hypothetical protein